jgi:hypothetical protein
VLKGTGSAGAAWTWAPMACVASAGNAPGG